MVLTARAPLGELDLVGAACLSPEEVLSTLGSGFDGVSSNDADERIEEFGPNALATHRVHATAVLFRQIRNPILVLLLGAVVVSGVTGGGTNAVIIVVIVALSVGLGFFNEYRAAVAMEALRGKIRHEAEVVRDGRSCRVPVTNLVPGDVVTLRIGDLVPADVRLLTVDELECDEGVLTGESMPVAKSAAPVNGRQALDQPGCAFTGTIVHQGSALGAVVGTAARTAFGQIAAGLTEKQGQTAFEVGLSRFSRFLFEVAAALTAFIFIINVALSRPLIEALLFSLAIAVGIAPRDDACHRDGEPGFRLEGAGSEESIGETAGGYRGSGQHRDSLHRQDGHSHRRSDHLRAGPRRQRARQRPSADLRAGVQRSDGH